MSRLEGFSDAVFGFALTLLVVSLEVPRTFHELTQVMSGFAAFGVSFALLMSVWFSHYIFFRRYGLHDPLTTLLNSILLFVILFYVYPLKFLFGWLFAGTDATVTLANGVTERVIEEAEIPQLMMIYGAGFALIFLLFVLLYLNAYRQRQRLDLNPVEVFETRQMILSNLLLTGIGLLSIAIAGLGGPTYTGLSGWTYLLTAPTIMLHRRWMGRQSRILGQRLANSGAPTK